MAYIVQNNVDTIYELINTLNYISNEEKLKNNFENILLQSNINKDTYIKKNLKNFYKFIDKFKTNINIPTEKLNMYFGEMFTGYSSKKNIASSIFTNISVEELKDFKEKLLSLTYDNSLKIIVNELVTSIENDEAKSIIGNIKNYEDLTDYLINNPSLKENSKWWISMICKHPQNYIIELIDILLGLVDDFNKCFKVFEKDMLNFIECLNTYTDSYDDLTGIHIETDEDILIYPSMITFNSVDATSSLGIIAPERTCFYIGYKFKELKELSHKNKDESLLFQDQLKCISDKSKFEILKLLNKEPLYGQELAQKLNLTTATISYHMNALLLSELICVTKVNNKFYYNVNSNSIDIFLKTLTNQLKSKN